MGGIFQCPRASIHITLLQFPLHFLQINSSDYYKYKLYSINELKSFSRAFYL
jgi:hypothetical protein